MLEARARTGGQCIETGLQHPGQRGRHPGRVHAGRVDVPLWRLRRRVDDPVVDEHLHQLLDVEGVAVGAVQDQLDQFVGDIVGEPEDLGDQQPRGHRAECVETDGLAVGGVAPCRSALVQRWTGRGHNEHGERSDEAGEPLDEIERLVVGPMHVLEEHHHRCLTRESTQELDEVGTGCDGKRVAFDARRRCAEIETKPGTERHRLVGPQRGRGPLDELGEDELG